MKKIPIGISSCLLGQNVRFDGGHKRDSYITGTLGQYFEFHPFCPEMGIGLGTPRRLSIWKKLIMPCAVPASKITQLM